jgi:hypothetical protein
MAFAPTQELLQSLFSYHEDGYFISKKTGKVVGDKVHAGRDYIRLCLKNKQYPFHRMVFLYHNGYLPEMLDHIDNNKVNNRIENLRPVTFQQNALNKKHMSTSSSPYKGVQKRKRLDGSYFYEVYVSVDMQSKFWGCFNDIEAANQKAISVRNQYHGQYARHA